MAGHWLIGRWGVDEAVFGLFQFGNFVLSQTEVHVQTFLSWFKQMVGSIVNSDVD